MADIDPIINKAKITPLARELWENAGRPAGRDQEFWFEAERRLKAAAAKESREPLAKKVKQALPPPPSRAAAHPLKGPSWT
jgi:hypothetical protein